jgi:hypothetical protein
MQSTRDGQPNAALPVVVAQPQPQRDGLLGCAMTACGADDRLEEGFPWWRIRRLPRKG